MKRIILIFLLSVTTVNFLIAQQSPKLVFILSPGFSLLQSPENFSDLWKPGLGLSTGLEYPIKNNLKFRGLLSFDLSSPDHDPFVRNYLILQSINPAEFDLNDWSIERGLATFMGACVDLKLDFPFNRKLTAYGFGGGGVNWFYVKQVSIRRAGGSVLSFSTPTVSKISPSVNFGAGMEFSLSELASIFVEANQMIAFTSLEMENLPFSSDKESVTYLKIRAGIRIR